MDARLLWTQAILAEMMLRELWRFYAVAQIATLRDMWLFYVRCAGIMLHWMYSWIYHSRSAMHGEKNEVWNDIIGTSGVQQYIARHSGEWTGPRHAAAAH
jgi:hypothetical protein